MKTFVVFVTLLLGLCLCRAADLTSSGTVSVKQSITGNGSGLTNLLVSSIVGDVLTNNRTVGTTLQNLTVSNLTANGGAYLQGSYVTVAELNGPPNLTGNWSWDISTQRYTATSGSDYGRIEWDTDHWKMTVHRDGTADTSVFTTSAGLAPTYIESAYAKISGDSAETPEVASVTFPPSLSITNGYVGINAANPENLLVIQGGYVRTVIGHEGMTLTGLPGFAGIAIDKTTGLMSVTGDKFLADVIADNTSDDSNNDIDLGTHTLLDSAGNRPYWTNQGNFYVTGTNTASDMVIRIPTNSILGFVDGEEIHQQLGNFASMASIGTNNCAILDGVYTNVAASLAFGRAYTNHMSVDLTAGFITNVHAGFYLITGSITIACAVANNADEIEVECFLNETPNDYLAARETLLGAGSYKTLVFSDTEYLSEGTGVSLRVKGIGTTDAIQIIHSSLTLNTP